MLHLLRYVAAFELFFFFFGPFVQIEIKQKDGVCPTPNAMAGQVVSYLEEEGYLHF